MKSGRLKGTGLQFKSYFHNNDCRLIFNVKQFRKIQKLTCVLLQDAVFNVASHAYGLTSDAITWQDDPKYFDKQVDTTPEPQPISKQMVGFNFFNTCMSSSKASNNKNESSAGSYIES